MSKDQHYTEFMDRFIRGIPPTEEEFIFHFEHQGGLPVDSLPVGSEAPAFKLPDRENKPWSLTDAMGEKGVLLVFARSAHWCPYCRNQLAELNVQAERMREAGYGIVAITPDPVQWIEDFCRENTVRYPILSDPQGEVIRAYKVLNDKIPPNTLQGGGPLPHPGHYLISREGRILAKTFTGDIRHRVSATALVAELSSDVEGAMRLSCDAFTAQIALSANELYGGQEFAVTLQISVTPGFHIYGPNAPRPYTPLSLHFESDGLLSEQNYTFPEVQYLELAALGERLPVLSGQFTVRGRLRLRWSPPRSPYKHIAERFSEQAIKPGDYKLTGTLHYQACSDAACLQPQAITFVLPIRVLRNAAAGSPVRFGDFEIPPPTE